jgi:L-alanine-DL-glutamate epimerase-like enolase superfamily enzyme
MPSRSLSIRGRDRRRVLSLLAGGVPAATLIPPASGLDAFAARAAQAPDADRTGRTIEAVEVLRVSGPVDVVPGVDRQWQSNPLHIYDARRPAPYREPAGRTPVRQTRTHHYVRIRTKNGLEGLYGYSDPEVVTPIVSQIGRIIIGHDALAVEALWDQMYRANRHARASHYMMALSQLDCALWDWRGRYYKAPVYELLGGPTRNPVKVYGSCLGFPVEPGAMAAKAKALLAQGFDFQKWFFTTGPGDGPKGLTTAIEMVRVLREAVGRDAEVMFDAYQAWDLQFARRWASAVEQYRPYFIEEAFPAADIDSFAALGRFTTIPVATGEHFYSRWEVHQYLKAGAATIIQADPEWCGGVSELVKICHLASVNGAMVIPHGHNIHAALHVVASQSPAVCPLVEFLIAHMADKVHFQKGSPYTDNGRIALPTTPGFGIELDASKIEKTEVIPATR